MTAPNWEEINRLAKLEREKEAKERDILRMKARQTEMKNAAAT